MFKYRFWYSEKQRAVQEEYDDGPVFVVLQNGTLLEYTEMRSHEGKDKPNWSDARLVYASDTCPQIARAISDKGTDEFDRLWGDMGELDEPDDMLAGFEAYDREAQEAWDEWMDNRPGPQESSEPNYDELEEDLVETYLGHRP